MKSNTTDKTEATEKASSFLSDYAGEIINAIKHAYKFQKDKELSTHFGVSSQSVANARKKVPIEWVFRCQQETGVEIGSLLPFTVTGKSLREVKAEWTLATITRMVDTLDKIGIDLPTAKKVELIAMLYTQQIEAEQQDIGHQCKSNEKTGSIQRDNHSTR